MIRLLKWLLFLLVLAAAAGGAWWWQTRPLPVTPYRVGFGAAVEAVYATGVVEPVEWARVGPLATARVVQILARDGQPVVQGQPLARLDDRELKAREAELVARQRYWEEEVRRASQLAERGIATQASRDRAVSELAAVRAQLAQIRSRIEDLVLTAPMDGVVLRQDGEVGEVVEARNTLFWIGRTQPLRITADIDEENLPRVALGQRVLIKADAFPDRVLEGRLEDITPKGDPLAKTFRSRIALDPTTPLRIGMSAELNIILREVPRTLVLPARALQPGGKVWRISADGLAELVPVRLGIQGPVQVEVVEGLLEGDSVIIDLPAGLSPGRQLLVEGG